MLSMSRRLTHEDLQQVRSSIDTTISQNKSLEQLQSTHSYDDSLSEIVPQIYENDINRKRKLIDQLVSITNSLIHDASILIESQQSVSDQNALLLLSLENLQNDHQLLRVRQSQCQEQNQSLRNLLVQSAHNIQKCQQQKEQLILSNRKIQEEFTELNQIFQSEKSKLKDQLSALTVSELNILSNRQFQLSEESAKIKSLQSQLADMRALSSEQKEVNLLMKKQLQLAQLSIKQLQEKIKGKQPLRRDKNLPIFDASHELSSDQSKLLERKNLKNQLELQNSLIENFSHKELSLEQINSQLIQRIQQQQENQEKQEEFNEFTSKTIIYQVNMQNSLQSSKKSDTSLGGKCIEEEDEEQFNLEQIVSEKPYSQTGIMPLHSRQSIIRPNTQNHISFIIDKVENEEVQLSVMQHIPKIEEVTERDEKESIKDFKKQKRLWMKSLEKQPKILKQLTRISTENQKKGMENNLLSPRYRFDRQKFQNKVLERKVIFDQMKTALLSEFGAVSRYSSKQPLKSP